jgi:serine/threonine-protein kinase HipA
MPTKKYQNEGGPGPTHIFELLRTYSTDRQVDVDTFAAALGFDWLIAGSDALAKNYSLLLSGPQVRLAPLYDVASILPYDNVDLRKIKLARKVGGEYKLSLIGPRQWQKFSREPRIDADKLIETWIAMSKQLPDEARTALARAREQGLAEPIVIRLVTRLIEGAGECSRSLCAASQHVWSVRQLVIRTTASKNRD